MKTLESVFSIDQDDIISHYISWFKNELGIELSIEDDEMTFTSDQNISLDNDSLNKLLIIATNHNVKAIVINIIKDSRDEGVELTLKNDVDFRNIILLLLKEHTFRVNTKNTEIKNLQFMSFDQQSGIVLKGDAKFENSLIMTASMLISNFKKFPLLKNSNVKAPMISIDLEGISNYNKEKVYNKDTQYIEKLLHWKNWEVGQITLLFNYKNKKCMSVYTCDKNGHLIFVR